MANVVSICFETFNTETEEWIERYKVNLIRPFYRIGRSNKCEICLDWKKTVSGVQARLYQIPPTMRGRGGYRLKDGDVDRPSTNGTFLNGSKLDSKESVKLKHGDLITLGPGLRGVYLGISESIADALESTLTGVSNELDLADGKE